MQLEGRRDPFPRCKFVTSLEGGVFGSSAVFPIPRGGGGGLILKNARARFAPGFVFAHDQIRKLEEAGGKLNFPFADG